ncbi:restriction endonuclease [Gracilibacillus sp. D59]|uniref:restriction endonuclease n=1 Tax=Gracilibacillus sp. D59 TaxID=3457434 RepID=UPI003FCE3AB9
MNRGYAGFYKGYYLRSSYEYAYARYLDYQKISWKYEVRSFDIGYKIYKPDFFLYDQNGLLIEIVEIKSRNKEAKENARKTLQYIEDKYFIKWNLISYEELLNLYKSLPFSLTSVITEWIKSDNTTINKAMFGKLNGHYNIRHNTKTKKIIGEHTKKLWASNTPSRKRMLEGLKKSGMKKGYIKTPRETRSCKKCGESFEITITSNKLFCSQKCAGKVAIKLATQSYVEKRTIIHQKIRDLIIEWTLENKKIVEATPFNKINTSLSPLLKEIYERFDVKDFRVISKAVFGEDRGRKELLKFMKKVCNEKVC